MEMKTACYIVQEFANERGMDILEGLQEMQAHIDYISDMERVAYRMFMRAGQQMFATRETA